MASASEGSGGGSVVVGKKYDPHTGKWTNVYGTPSKGSGSSKGSKKTKKPPKKSTSKSNSKPSKPKPTTPDKGNDHRSSGKDVAKVVAYKSREIEYDLEGSAEVRPYRGLKAREILNFQGLGNNFSGKYFLSTVTHTINRSGYTMELEVLRKGFEWKISKPSTSKGKTKVTPKKKATSKKRYYTVKRGDNLWNIAKRYNGKGSLWRKIYDANKSKIKKPDLIYPGQKFLIP
jgi:nucleoid-associated protein YgaU